MVHAEPALDASKMPLDAYGSKGTMWWGIMALIVIEAMFFGLLAVSYFYYRMRYVDWPPADLPALGLPLVNLVVIMAACYPLWIVERGAPDRSPTWIAKILGVSSMFIVAAVVLRIFEFSSLRTNYDSHSYGSITWALLFTHGLELLLTLGETMLLSFYAATNHDLDVKHRSDIRLNSIFYYFLAITWIAIFGVIQIGGRVL
jgi:cytochrome c oxidase subunit 3